MNVALCDDDTVFLTELNNKISGYDGCKIYLFNSLNALTSSDIVFDIAFLDIELDNDKTGFQAVSFLRNRNKKCIIAFFTNYTQYAVKGYEYRAFRYILKTEPDALIERHIKDVFGEYARLNKTISGSYNGYTFSTPLDEIYYISISNHVITLHTDKGDFEIYKQMKDLNSELCAAGFVRCHRSFMVNMRHVFVLRSDCHFILDDTKRTAVPIGIRYRETAEKEYLNFVSVGGN